MSALIDGLLGSLAASPKENSAMSGSFQSGVGGGDYDYDDGGVRLRVVENFVKG